MDASYSCTNRSGVNPVLQNTRGGGVGVLRFAAVGESLRRSICMYTLLQVLVQPCWCLAVGKEATTVIES